MFNRKMLIRDSLPLTREESQALRQLGAVSKRIMVPSRCLNADGGSPWVCLSVC
jgi:hypothetical protein